MHTVRRALNQLQEAGFVSWIRRLVRTKWRVEQTSSAYTLVVPTPAHLFNAFLKHTAKLASRAKCVSQVKPPEHQEKAPSLIDVAAARAALEARRRVIEGRLMRLI